MDLLKEDEPESATAKQLFVEPEACIDCGACVPVCPVQSIFPLEELPEKYAGLLTRVVDGVFLRVAG